MNKKIIGRPTVTPPPKPNWYQNDASKGDYIVNKPNVANALICKVVGNTLAIDDISPIKHDIKLSIKSKNKLPASALDLANWKNTASKTYQFYPIELEAGKTYCLSGYSNSTSGSYDYLYLRKSNDDFATANIVIQLFKDKTHSNGRTFVAEEGYKYSLYYYGTAENFSQYYDLMIEEGTSITNYTPYVDDFSDCGVNIRDKSNNELQRLYANSNGFIEGVEYFSYMKIGKMYRTADNNPESVYIEAKYNRDINKAFEELKNVIISLGGNV